MAGAFFLTTLDILFVDFALLHKFFFLGAGRATFVCLLSIIEPRSLVLP